MFPKEYSCDTNTVACPRNDTNTVVSFLQKNILSRFGTPRTIISDGGSHFANKIFSKLMSRYVIKHMRSLAYHPPDQWTGRDFQQGDQKNLGKDCKFK